MEVHLLRLHEILALLFGAESGEHAALEDETLCFCVHRGTSRDPDLVIEGLEEVERLDCVCAGWEAFHVGHAAVTFRHKIHFGH